MSIDESLALKLAIEEDGQEAIIGADSVDVLLSEPDTVADPYVTDLISDSPNPWLALAIKSHLTDKGLWPLPVERITIDEQHFRVLRSQARRGEVHIYLREES